MSEGIIRTFSRRNHQLINPDLQDVPLIEIAHSLAMQVRYTGHIPVFYSVATHCRKASELVKLWGGTLIEQQWAHVHDASETWLGDIASPLKRQLTDYREIEDTYHPEVAKRFGLPEQMPGIVKLADKVIAAIEVRDLWHEDYTQYPWDNNAIGVENDFHVEGEEWPRAEARWMRRALELNLD